MYKAVELAAAILEILIVSIYLKGLYQNYVRSKLFLWVAYTVASIILYLLNILPIPQVVLLGYSFVSFFILSVLMFNAKWMHAFYSALLLCGIIIGVTSTIFNIITHFGIPAETLEIYGNNMVLYIVLEKMVEFFFVYLAVKISRLKKAPRSVLEAVPLLVSQVFSIFVCYLMYMGTYKAASQITLGFIIGALGILYINIAVVLYVERIKETSEIKRQNELADLQYQLKVEYFNQIKKDQDDTRALWHDIRKYLNTMNELMNRGDIVHAKECITQAADLFGGIGNVVDVGNTVIGAVLNHSVQKAQRMYIETELDIRVQPDLNVSAADLSVIIGNTFDNAIEACMQIEHEKPKIQVQLIQKGTMLYYEIRNPYKPDVDSEVKNPKQHGFGLRNVRRCIDKYKGTMSVHTGETHFAVSIHINIPADQRTAQMVS